MKTARRTCPQAGYIVWATMCAALLVGIALISSLRLTTYQQRVAARSQAWNMCMPLAEAGAEEALTHCHLNFTNLASEGWIYSAATKTFFKAHLLEDGHYHVSFTESTPRTILATGYVHQSGTSALISRAVRVVNDQSALFNNAIRVRGLINLGGNNLQTDSYDSRSPDKSTDQNYDPTKAGDRGDIVCSNITNAGDAKVCGHVVTPQALALNVGSNGTVGSVFWHKAANTGVESGWWGVNTNLDRYPTIKAPFTTGLPAKSGSIDGVTYDYIFDSSNYAVQNISGNVLITGNATVYSSGPVRAALVLQNNASLKLYVHGPNCEFTSFTNANNYAGSCVIYGLPSCTSLKLAASANLTCAIYVPQAHLELQGGAQLSGALVCNELTIRGHSEFHFDEALAHDPELVLFELHEWTEL